MVVIVVVMVMAVVVMEVRDLLHLADLVAGEVEHAQLGQAVEGLDLGGGGWGVNDV